MSRMRKELRDLTSDSWNRVVKAIWVMKTVSTQDGIRKYGRHYVSYDRLTLQHINAASDRRGDQAHFSHIFPIFHRLWLLRFENSLLAIDPLIEGLPYWDAQRDNLATSTGYRSIFSDSYLGEIKGSALNSYQVRTGKFAYWPITIVANSSDEDIVKYSHPNPYGFLRHPLSINGSPYLSRNGLTLCGASMTTFSVISAWESCFTTTDIVSYVTCIDTSLHAPAHVAVGGSWKRSPRQTDNTSCAQWFGKISSSWPEIPVDILGTYIHPVTKGCFTCPKCYPKQQPIHCGCKPISASCGPLWTGLMNLDNSSEYMVQLVQPQAIQVLGDFSDPLSSPNDPIFPFHHCNLDRHFTLWMKKRDSSNDGLGTASNYYNFPTDGNYASGCKLNDIISSTDGFNMSVLFPYYEGKRKRAILVTVKDIFRYLGSDSNSIYQYQNSTPTTVSGLANNHQGITYYDKMYQQNMFMFTYMSPFLGVVVILSTLFGFLIVFYCAVFAIETVMKHRSSGIIDEHAQSPRDEQREIDVSSTVSTTSSSESS